MALNDRTAAPNFHGTCAAGDTERVTLSTQPPMVEILNRDSTAANVIYVSVAYFENAVPLAAPVAQAANTYAVGAGQSLTIPSIVGDSVLQVHLIAAAGSPPYSVHSLFRSRR